MSVVFINQAATEAFKQHPDVEEHIRKCTAIHRIVTRWSAQKLRRMGAICAMPQGAFYLYPDFEQYRAGLARVGIETSESLALRLLQQFDVVTLACTAFGDDPTKLKLRLAMCDYDGTQAMAVADNYNLNDIDQDPKRTEAFVRAAAPNVDAGLDAIAKFLATVQK